MRRFCFTLAILLAAVFANYLVAWGCVMWMPEQETVFPPPAEPDSGMYRLVPHTYGEPDGLWAYTKGFGWSQIDRAEVWHSESEPLDGISIGGGTPVYRTAGWPMEAIQSVVRMVELEGATLLTTWPQGWNLPTDEIIRRGYNTSDLPRWMHAKPKRRLPLIPIWPGFLVNTLIYALVIATHWRGAVWIIGRRRTHRTPARDGPAI